MRRKPRYHLRIKYFKHTANFATFRGLYIGKWKFLYRPRHKGYSDKFGHNDIGGFVIPLFTHVIVIVHLVW